MHPRTLGLWRAVHRIDPWDENRADWRAAEIAAATVAAQGATKRDGSHFTPEDFAPYLKLQMDPEELRRLEIEREEAALMEFLANASGHQAHAYSEND